MKSVLLSVVTTQYQMSTKSEMVYEICGDDGRFRMPRDQLAGLLADLMLCAAITRVELQGDGPLVITHVALDIAARDSVWSILSRYCIDDDFRAQWESLSRPRPLPESHGSKPLESL